MTTTSVTAICLMLLAAGVESAPKQPGVNDLAIATRKVRLVFGDRASKAKSAESKRSLAGEMLKAADTETDSAAKFALLRQARDLAVGASDMKLAIDVTRRIAVAFSPSEAIASPESPDALIAKGNTAWEAAEKETVTAAQIDGKFAAVEWYLRAQEAATGLGKALIAKRLAELEELQTPDGDGIYLSNLRPIEIHLHSGWDIKTPVKVGGSLANHGLSTHPPADGAAQVIYSLLSSEYKLLVGKAAIDDSTGSPVLPRPLVFRIVGDGKQLWKSKPMSRRSDSAKFSVRIAGIKKLAIFVDCRGSNSDCHAVWVDPKLCR
jgi:NPCBM/NEW2 domain